MILQKVDHGNGNFTIVFAKGVETPTYKIKSWKAIGWEIDKDTKAIRFQIICCMRPEIKLVPTWFFNFKKVEMKVMPQYHWIHEDEVEFRDFFQMEYNHE